MGSSKLGTGLRDRFILAISLLALVGAARLFAFSVELAAAPGNDLKLTLSAIQSAQDSLFINIYEMKSTAIAEAIVDRVNEGLQVEILLEGQPVGGVSKAEKALQEKIVDAMTGSRSKADGDHFYLMTSKASRSKRRYRWDHAKYVVVDHNALLIGSENFSESSHSASGKRGNRGWETFLHDAMLAKSFEKIFRDDTDLSYGDVEDLTDNSRSSVVPEILSSIAMPLPVMLAPHRPGAQKSDLPDNTTIDVDSASCIFSPDSLSGLVGLLKGAKKSLKLEMMTFSPKWGSTGVVSPLLEAVESAARRGVDVEVLLNDETVFQHGGGKRVGYTAKVAEASKNNNETTVKFLNDLAGSEELSLEARIANLKEMGVSYIHNKGVLVDGEKVLVSSINWDQNSVEKNREAGVVLTSKDAYGFYQQIFDQDWKDSE